MKIEYIVNARIPTSRAQGYAIMKMCEQFAALENTVDLVVPNRENNESDDDPFHYYNIQKNFSLTKLKSSDLLSNSHSFGRLYYWIDMISFLLSIKSSNIARGGDIVYTRDYLVLLSVPKDVFAVLEVHEIPHSTWLFRRLIKKPQLIFVLTHYLKDIIVKMGVPAERVHVIPSGVELKDFEVASTKQQARKLLGLNEQDAIAMYIGLLDEWKGYRTFLDASKELEKEGIKSVVIGGEPHHIAPLKEKYPNVQFLGVRPYSELGINQKAADILVVPNSGKYPISRYYTSPLKVFAHMAGGVPIVASDLPSLREVLNEKNSVFFEADNAQSLAQAIIRVVKDKELGQALVEQAQKDVVQYGWTNRAGRIMDAIIQLYSKNN